MSKREAIEAVLYDMPLMSRFAVADALDDFAEQRGFELNMEKLIVALCAVEDE